MEEWLEASLAKIDPRTWLPRGRPEAEYSEVRWVRKLDHEWLDVRRRGLYAQRVAARSPRNLEAARAWRRLYVEWWSHHEAAQRVVGLFAALGRFAGGA